MDKRQIIITIEYKSWYSSLHQSEERYWKEKKTGGREESEWLKKREDMVRKKEKECKKTKLQTKLRFAKNVPSLKWVLNTILCLCRHKKINHRVIIQRGS